MKPAPFRYHEPASVEEAASLLGQLDNARLLAGGQSLMPMMNFRFVMPDDLIDLNRIAALSSIEVGPDAIRFGGMTRQRDIEFSESVKAASPIILEALSHVGHRQTRNRGTIGGSLCHLDPSAELANMAMLHDATIEAQSARGKRTISASQFAVSYMTTALAPDEMLTAVEFRIWGAGHGYAFEEFARRHGDFAICAVGVLVKMKDDVIERAAVAISGVAQVPFRATEVEAIITDRRPSHDLIRAAAIAAQKAEAMSDAYVTAAYRQHLARVLTYRAISKAVDRAQKESLR
jgi:carbon-monoxide dehydrogenase medium subunit